MQILIYILSLIISVSCNKSATTTEMVNVDNLYIRSTVVTEFIYETDEVVVEDNHGNMYAFYGIEDWCVEDKCILLMNTNGTNNITDDIIIRAFYRSN